MAIRLLVELELITDRKPRIYYSGSHKLMQAPSSLYRWFIGNSERNPLVRQNSCWYAATKHQIYQNYITIWAYHPEWLRNTT